MLLLAMIGEGEISLPHCDVAVWIGGIGAEGSVETQE